MNGKRFSENKARKNGFYLALAVCLVAVGIAAWSTYDAVHSYVKPTGSGEESALERSTQIQMEGEDVRSGQETGAEPSSQSPAKVQIPDQDPEKPAASSAPARQTGASVTVKPSATPKPSPEPSEEPVEPANAPLYERSSQMIYPLASTEIAKAYSSGAPVYSETMKDWRIHTGLDEAAQAGEAVKACANGQVKKTYTDGMLGNVIVIEHGDYEFSYCGVSEDFPVKEGDIVTKGQVIGSVTAVPCEAAEAPHLHLEVRRDGTCLDPQSVIEAKE